MISSDYWISTGVLESSRAVSSRSTFTEYYEMNRKTYQEKEHLYKRRQAIVEHPYGTLKRQWGSAIFLRKRV